MAKRPIHKFDAETAFTLLYTALLPLGHRIHSSHLGSCATQTFLHDKMRLVVTFTKRLPHLQICTMHDTPILKLWFQGHKIRVTLSRRHKSSEWQVPVDKSVLDAEVLLIQIAATINQYVRDHYEHCLIETAEDITNFGKCQT